MDEKCKAQEQTDEQIRSYINRVDGVMLDGSILYHHGTKGLIREDETVTDYIERLLNEKSNLEHNERMALEKKAENDENDTAVLWAILAAAVSFGAFITSRSEAWYAFALDVSCKAFIVLVGMSVACIFAKMVYHFVHSKIIRIVIYVAALTFVAMSFL